MASGVDAVFGAGTTRGTSSSSSSSSSRTHRSSRTAPDFGIGLGFGMEANNDAPQLFRVGSAGRLRVAAATTSMLGLLVGQRSHNELPGSVFSERGVSAAGPAANAGNSCEARSERSEPRGATRAIQLQTCS
jgi:hypothetical protein